MYIILYMVFVYLFNVKFNSRMVFFVNSYDDDVFVFCGINILVLGLSLFFV